MTLTDITAAGGASAAALGNYVPIAGGTITGNFSVVGTTWLGNGALRVDPGGTLTTSGSLEVSGEVRAYGAIVAEGNIVYFSDPGQGYYATRGSDNSRYLNFWPGYYFTFNGSNGYLTYVANNAGIFNISPGGNVYAPGGVNCGAWGITYSSYSGNQIAFHWTNTNLQARVDNTNQGLIYTTLHPPPSDARLKDLIGEYRGGLAELLKLRTVRYKWNSRNPDGVDGRERVGVVAQDVEATGDFPFILDKRKGIIDGVEVDDYMGLDPMQLIWPMINALKEIDKRLAALESAPWA
jgi:hypothetical protein